MGGTVQGRRLHGRLFLVYALKDQISIWRNLKYIRLVETLISQKYHEQKMRCPTHLSIGQECAAAAVGVLFGAEDLAVSGHRAHAHYLGCGGDLFSMIAEIYGLPQGCSRGVGGSMHLVDESVGFMGSTAIVGGTLPVGLGLAMAQKIEESNAITWIFLGDAAVETGVFYETVNLAAVHELPIIFVCENNMYSVYTSLSSRQPKHRSISSMAAGLGLDSTRGFGNQPKIVFELLSSSANKAREGGGPQFVELETYRWLEHCGPNKDDDLGYRPEAEVLQWMSNDPLDLMVEELSERLTKDEISRLDFELNQELEAVVNDVFSKVEKHFDGQFSVPIPVGEYCEAR